VFVEYETRLRKTLIFSVFPS